MYPDRDTLSHVPRSGLTAGDQSMVESGVTDGRIASFLFREWIHQQGQTRSLGKPVSFVFTRVSFLFPRVLILIENLTLLYKSNRPHFLWVYRRDNPLRMLGEHEKSFGSWFTSFPRVLPTSRVGYHAGKPIESVVYCLSILSRYSSITSCKRIQDSLGFWISHRGFRIQDTGFQSLSLELGFWIPIVSGIPDSISKNFPDSGIRIPLIGVFITQQHLS